MGKKDKRHVKRNGLFLRLTDKQLDLLTRYTELRDFESKVDALRYMVSGLEEWLNRQETAIAIPAAEAPKPETPHSGQSAHSNEELNETEEWEEDDSDEGEALGTFGGRLSVRLPGEAEYDDQGEYGTRRSISND